MIYPVLRHILFRFDAESVHERVLKRLELLQRSAGGRTLLRGMAGAAPHDPWSGMGLKFSNRLGIAAGFDKDARVVVALQELGFGHIEIGTVTPRPQPGNPKPRIWRFPEACALINALGFPGEGMHRVGERLRQLRESGRLRVPLGINLGKNADTPAERAAGDYTAVLEHLHEWGDYFVVNVSSPNTPGLRDLQSLAKLEPILGRLSEANNRRGAKPLLVKIAPDLTDEELSAIAMLVRRMEFAGIIAGNTTVRRELVPRAHALDRGGLSGVPLYPRTRQMIPLLRSELNSAHVLIAAGGIFSAEQAREIRVLGADLIQVYTAFVYHGPRCVTKLSK